LVSVAELLCVYGTLLGSGVFGSHVSQVGGAAFAADATLIAPAVPAFAIWSVVYLGLFAVAIWFWLPDERAAARLGPVAWLVIGSMLLNAAWILVVQAGWIAASVAVIVALVVDLGLLVDRLGSTSPRSRVEAVVIDGTFGLYLGWVCVATCANVAAALVAAGVPATGTGPQVATVSVLVVVGLLGLYLSRRMPGQLGIPVGMIWGLAWIAYNRSHGTPVSMSVALAAAVVGAWIAGAFAQTATRRFIRHTPWEAPHR